MNRSLPYVTIDKLQKDHPDRKKLEAFLDWLKANKVDTSNLDILYKHEEERKLKASRFIKKGEEVLFIPMELILKFDDAKNTFIGS